MGINTTRRTFLKNVVAGGVISAASLSNFNSAFAARGNVNFEHVRTQIKKAVSVGSPASMTVAVAKDGKIIWEEAFGWANRDKRILATVDTRYAVASLSKPFTALGIMVLVERGLIKLDDSASRYLGNIKLNAYEGNAATVSIKHLLQHTSGLPRHWRNFYSDENQTPLKLEETFNRYGILVNSPGTEYLYTNLGYGLLAHIIERVSGIPFSKFMLKEVFLPLNMNNTTVENTFPQTRPTAALYNTNGQVVPFYVVDESGSMAVASTIRDLTKFGMFHLKTSTSGQKQIIKPASIDRMGVERQAISVSNENGTNLFYGLGWVGREKSQYNYYNLAHSGDAPGVSSLLTILSNERIAVAAIANTRFTELIYTVADEVFDTLLPDNKKMRENDPSMKPPSAVPPFKPTEELIGKWKGEIKTYSGTIPATISFQPNGDVHFKMEGQLETLISQVRFEDGKIIGRSQGTITNEDAMRRPHQLRFVLKQKCGVLSGTVHAQSSIDAQAKNMPDRDYFALASWIKLTKSN